jgi:hypothetical protein
VKYNKTFVKQQKMVDNAETLVSFLWNRLTFTGEHRLLEKDHFFYFYVSQRKKDGHADNAIIREFYIGSPTEFWELYPLLKNLCIMFKARLYVNPNVRSFQRAALETNKLIAEYMLSGQYDAVKNAYSRCVGRFHSEPKNGTCWIIDVDYDELPNIVDRMGSDLSKWGQDQIESAMKADLECLQCTIGLVIPTKNGKHYLVSPFNIEKWEALPYKYGIQKNAPTLLLAP